MRRLHVLRSGGRGKRARLLLTLVVSFLVAASLVLAGPAAPAGASSGTIVPGGSPVTVSVTTAGQTGVVTFTGMAGETLSLRAANWTFPADGGTTLQVEGGTSQPIGPTGTLNGTGVVTLEPIVLPSAGQYSVVIDPSGLGDVGSVQLTLTDIGSVTPGGAAVTVSVGTAGQVGAVSFQGTAGELVGVQVDNSTFPSDSLTTLAITDSSGAPQSSVVYLNGGSSPFLGPVKLAQAGIYVIMVDPTNGTDTGSAQLTLTASADTTGSITPNGPAVTAAITVPGQRDILTFTAAAGQEFGIQASDSTFPSGATAPRFYIADSSGQEVGGDNYIYDPPVVDGPVTVSAAGTYQVVVDPGPDSAATGTVSVKLVSFTDQTGTLTPGGPAVTADITAPSQRAVYTFSGTASEKFVVSYTSSTFTLDSDVLDVVDPTGKDVAQIPIDAPAGTTPAVTLPAAGTYQVIVDPTSQGDTGSISLSLLSVTDIQGTITPGSPVNVSITTPGQRAFYTFTTTTTGQQVSFTVADSTFTSNKDELYVVDANGNGVGNTYFLADGTLGPITLGSPGTYQVVIDPAAYDQNDTGTLTLTLTPPGGQAAAIHSVPIQPQAQAVLDSYHARTLAGQALAASSPAPGVILIATLTETITTDGCTDSCAGTSSHEVQKRAVTWTAKSDGTSAGTVQGTDTDTGTARGPVCTFPYYSDSAADSSGTGTGDASISYLPDGANLDTYTIDLGAITGTTDTVANSIMAGHCVGIEPPTPARTNSTSTTTNILASDHTVTGEIANNATQVTGQLDCGSGTTVTNDIALIATTTTCTIAYKLLKPRGNLVLKQTPKTPLWDLDLVATPPPGWTCSSSSPITVTVTSAGINSGQFTGCPNVAVRMPVFEAGGPQMNPDANNAFTVQMSDGSQQATWTQELKLPKAPVWIAVGDSTSSGWNQTSNGYFYSPNDVSYSWPNTAYQAINTEYQVPPSWAMSLDSLARGGWKLGNVGDSCLIPDGDTFEERDTILCSQDLAMRNSLVTQKDSWNVVSVTGGANDLDLGGVLKKFYCEESKLCPGTHPAVLPWNVPSGSAETMACPDTNSMGILLHGNTGRNIKTAIQKLLNDARHADPNVRLLDQWYQQVVPPVNVCGPSIARNGITTWYGATAVIRDLNGEHHLADKAVGSIATLDSSTIFANDILGSLQLIWVWGYPHLNGASQILLGDDAATIVENITGGPN
jgi:hypothetical protein